MSASFLVCRIAKALLAGSAFAYTDYYNNVLKKVLIREADNSL